VPALLIAAVIAVGVSLVVQGLRATPAPRVLPVTVLSGDWEPYTGPQLNSGGPATEILVDVLALTGFEADVQFTTWESATQRVSENTAFGAYPLVASSSRAETMLFSDPVIEFEYVLFYRAAEGPPATSAAELSGLRAGGIAGYDYWPDFDSAVGDVTSYPDAAAAILALSRGEVDVVAEGSRSGMAALVDPAVDIDSRSIAVIDSNASWARSTQGLYFAMPNLPESAEVMKRFNAALATYQAGQEYARHVRVIDGTTPSQVVLVATLETGLVALRDEVGDLVAQSPAGTTAAVLEWPRSWTQTDGTDTLTRIKITSGPSAGHVYYVDGRTLDLVQP